MNRALIIYPIILILGLVTGCSYIMPKPDPPPPLPPIIEPKPPLTLKSDHFKGFPWDDLPEPQKDGNDVDTTTYILKDGDTLEIVAEKRMGERGMADRLASYNELPSASTAKPGDKIVIPNPILGVSSQIMVKAKGDKEFGDPGPFPVEFKKGDRYKLRFECNVNGYCYILREGVKQVAFLYPPRKKPATGRARRRAAPVERESAQVKPYDPIIIPADKKGFAVDPKKAGSRLYVFLSLREIPSLEDLKDKKTIPREELEDVMRRVKDGQILDDPPYHLLRVADPNEILGFTINIDG